MFFDVFEKLCKEKGVSCKKAAMDIGLSNSLAVKWKNGATPGGESLKKLSKYFDVSVDFLLEKDKNKHPHHAFDEGSIDVAGFKHIDAMYMRLAQAAQDMELDDEDIEIIIKSYEKHRQRNEKNKK